MRKFLHIIAWILTKLGRKRIIYDHMDPEREYMHRYYLVGWRNHKYFTLAIHHILCSDMDGLHDHPFGYAAFILAGGYTEHCLSGSYRRMPGSLRFRCAESFHRLEAGPKTTWSLFAMGPRTKDWGFLVDGKWVDHQTHLGHRDDDERTPGEWPLN